MGYPSDLKVVSRKLTSNIAIGSLAFSRFNVINFGARMAAINHDDSIIIWSAMPYGPQVEEVIGLVAQKPFNISHLIIPDNQHTMAAKLFKDKYPQMKIIAPEGVDVPGLPLDYVITSDNANKILDTAALNNIGITDPVITENFQFVYLPSHANKELVTYDIKLKTVFEADLLFNLGVSEQLEQYSRETGFSDLFNPHGGLSFLTRYMQPHSKVGNGLTRKIVHIKNAAPGLQAIYSWDFNTIVPCHGNVIDKGAKDAFKSTFAPAFTN